MSILSWINRYSNQLISIAIAIAVAVVAIQQGSALVEALKQVRMEWALAGLCCYGVNYLLRALRVKVLVKKSFRMWPDAVHTACLHGLATYLLPFRTGDFTLPVILKKATRMSLAEGAKVLLTVRMLDLWALGWWILSTAIIVTIPLPLTIHLLWAAFGIVLSLLPLVLKWGVGIGRQRKGRLWNTVVDWHDGAAFNLANLAISLGIWACVAACFYCTAQAIGLRLGVFEVWLLITIQLPLQMVPLQGVANAGNHEGGWIAGLAILGIPADQGLHYALISHALLLTYVLALGPLVLLLRNVSAAENTTKV